MATPETNVVVVSSPAQDTSSAPSETALEAVQEITLLMIFQLLTELQTEVRTLAAEVAAMSPLLTTLPQHQEMLTRIEAALVAAAEELEAAAEQNEEEDAQPGAEEIIVEPAAPPADEPTEQRRGLLHRIGVL